MTLVFPSSPTVGQIYNGEWQWDGTKWVCVGTASPPTITVQRFTSSGTYTPTAGMQWAFVECMGGGGAGGGVVSAASAARAGGGGGSGSYTRAWISASVVGASQTVTVGAGGTPASGAAGGNGGASSFGTLVTATGGQGGGVMDGSGNQGNAGGAGILGTVTGGAINAGIFTGNVGGWGLCLPNPQSNSQIIAYTGSGAASPIGDGGATLTNIGSAGTVTGSNAPLGGGGGGAASYNIATNAAGGNGGGGWVQVTEYTF